MPDELSSLTLPRDVAQAIQDALGHEATEGDPNSDTVTLELDAETMAKVKSALTDGLAGTAGIAFGRNDTGG